MKPITLAGARALLAVAKSFGRPEITLYERILTTVVALEKSREEVEKLKATCEKLTLERDAVVRELDALRERLELLDLKQMGEDL